jgi:hypothetical protein
MVSIPLAVLRRWPMHSELPKRVIQELANLGRDALALRLRRIYLGGRRKPVRGFSPAK